MAGAHGIDGSASASFVRDEHAPIQQHIQKTASGSGGGRNLAIVDIVNPHLKLLLGDFSVFVELGVLVSFPLLDSCREGLVDVRVLVVVVKLVYPAVSVDSILLSRGIVNISAKMQRRCISCKQASTKHWYGGGSTKLSISTCSTSSCASVGSWSESCSETPPPPPDADADAEESLLPFLRDGAACPRSGSEPLMISKSSKGRSSGFSPSNASSKSEAQPGP